MENVYDTRLDEKKGAMFGKTAVGDDLSNSQSRDGEEGTMLVIEKVDNLKRRLSGRQINMMVIGGSIGTALFVSIGYGLVAGGPGSMLIAFCIYGCFMASVNNSMAEVIYPLSPLRSQILIKLY